MISLAAFDPAVVGLLGVLLGGGFIGGIAAFRKAGSESTAIGIQSLIAVNKELRGEVQRLTAQVQELRHALEERERLR